MEQLSVMLAGAQKHSLLARQDDTGDNTSETASISFCLSPVNITGPSCAGPLNAYTAVSIILILVALAAVIILSAIQRRVKIGRNVCWGYPGIATPLNLLETTRYRFIYAIIFGIMSYQFFAVALSGLPQFWTPPESKFARAILGTFSRLIFVLLVTFLYYPLLATVNCSIPLIGLAIGAIYSTIWFTFTLINLAVQYTGCDDGCASDPITFFVLLLGQIPLLLCHIGVVLWFIIRLIQEIFRLIKSPKPFLIKLKEKPTLMYHENRVRVLLKSVRVQNNQTTWRKLLKKVYPYNKSFQFPLRFLIAMTATFFLILAMSTNMVLFVIGVSTACGFLSTFILSSYDDLDLTEIFGNASSFQEEYLDVGVRIVADSLLGFAVIMPIGTLLVIGLIYFMMFLMYRSVSESIQMASRGDFSFLTLKKPPLYRSLDASIKYIGYQVAYFIWAMLLYMAIVIVGGIVLVLGAVFLIHAPSLIVDYILPLLLGFVWSQVIYWGQIIFCWLFFTKKDGDTVYVHNRRLYNWVAYILLFQNAFVGFFSAILRFLKSALFGLIIVTRLDRVLYMKGFERFDSAYRTFVGFLVLDLAINNSVMHVFCKLLLERRKLCSESSSDSGSEPGKYQLVREGSSSPVTGNRDQYLHSRRARNRWMKAYTLLRNPSLIETTGQKLEEKRLQSSLAFTGTTVELVSL